MPQKSRAPTSCSVLGFYFNQYYSLFFSRNFNQYYLTLLVFDFYFNQYYITKQCCAQLRAFQSWGFLFFSNENVWSSSKSIPPIIKLSTKKKCCDQNQAPKVDCKFRAWNKLTWFPIKDVQWQGCLIVFYQDDKYEV